MEQSPQKWTVTLILDTNKNTKLTLQTDPILTPAQRMTAFLFAKDTFKQEILNDEEIAIKLMFDEHNPTVDDEVVTQAL